MDMTEAKGAIDEGCILAGSHATAHFLIIVEQPEPDLIEVPPGNLVGRCPIIEIRAVVDSARSIEIHQRRERVFIVPVGGAHPHKIATGGVSSHRRIEGRSQLEMRLEVLVPFGTARRINLVPQTRHLAEAHLLVVVDLIDGPWLNYIIFEQRLEMAVEMG